MNAEEKLRKGYVTHVRGQNAVPPGVPAAKFITVEFRPRQLMKEISQEGALPISPAPKALVVEEYGEMRVAWEVSPTDPEITQEQFSEEAKRRAKMHLFPSRLTPHQKAEEGRKLALAQLGTDKIALVIAQSSVLSEHFAGEDYIRVLLLSKDKAPDTSDVIIRMPMEWLNDKEPQDFAVEIIQGAHNYIEKMDGA